MKHHKILACAQSNTAADNLLEGLILLGVNVVRFGRPANVRESLWDYTVDSRLQKRSSWVRARGNLDNAVKNYNSCLEKGVFQNLRSSYLFLFLRSLIEINNV